MANFIAQFFKRRSVVREALLQNKMAYADDLRVGLNETRAKLHAAQCAIERLQKVEAAARELESFLGRNSGTTADWPINIKIRGDHEVADELCRLLNQLKDSLKSSPG
jgi:hypothetical protein